MKHTTRQTFHRNSPLVMCLIAALLFLHWQTTGSLSVPILLVAAGGLLLIALICKQPPQ